MAAVASSSPGLEAGGPLAILEHDATSTGAERAA